MAGNLPPCLLSSQVLGCQFESNVSETSTATSITAHHAPSGATHNHLARDGVVLQCGRVHVPMCQQMGPHAACLKFT